MGTGTITRSSDGQTSVTNCYLVSIEEEFSAGMDEIVDLVLEFMEDDLG